MVAATAVDRKAPTRFSDADSVTATLGFRAPLAIEVAIALPGVVEAVREVEGERGDTTMIRRNN